MKAVQSVNKSVQNVYNVVIIKIAETTIDIDVTHFLISIDYVVQL